MAEEIKGDCLTYPDTIENIDGWAFRYKFEFFQQLESFVQTNLLTDYISAKVIISNKVAILSTQPAVELNIINSNLYCFDKSFSLEFHRSENYLLWNESFYKKTYEELKFKKMDNFGFTSGISLAIKKNYHLLSISFATRSKDPDIDNYYINNLLYLKKICLFVEKISYHMFESIFSIKIPNPDKKLFLIINNKK